VKCKSVTDVFFRNQTTTYSEDPNNWTLQNETDELKKIFALFLLQAIGRCATFENSIKLYELYICAFGDQEVERFKVLTKVFHNCAQWEYHNMITFWKDLKTNTEIDSNSQKILANVIMEKVPSYEIALEYMKELDERQIDSYSLFHILNHLNKLAKKHPDDELFKKALEVIEDKRLSRFKSEGQILNRLYQIANNEEQEKIVDEIAGETATNRVFVSIKMGKAYRTLEDVYKLYLEFHKNQEQIYSDVFSSMVLRLVKEEKENANEKIRAELEKECNKKFHLKDSHYLMALIRLGKIAIFNDENGFSNEFLANVDKLDTTDSWRKLIQEYRRRNSGKIARQKMLCAKYIEKFIARKYPYEMYPDYVIKNWLIEFQLDIDNYQADVEAIWEEAFKKEQEKKFEDAIQLYLQIQSVRKYVATRLGQCYRQLGQIEDAVQWTLQGLDEGCFFAPYNLYMIYKYDKYQRFYDIDKAIDYLIIAKERGNKKAKEELEKWYKRFTPLKEHITKSPIIQLTRHSFSVSTILKIGKARSISKDEWYKMGACYYKNEHYMLCVECYHLAADLGHTKAANYLWKWYQDGTYVVKNQLMVRRYLMIAAQFKENKTAAKELKNFQNAENLFQQGMIFYKAALSYNNPYLRTHQDKKFKNAIEKFSEASSKGLAEASHYLGYCHFKGLGTEQNMDKAIEYYKKSAELGYDSSQFSLGQIYETQNMDEAIKWYQLAAEQGHEKAQQRLEQLNGENKCY
jgi:TPR repeat protein